MNRKGSYRKKKRYRRRLRKILEAKKKGVEKRTLAKILSTERLLAERPAPVHSDLVSAFFRGRQALQRFVTQLRFKCQ